MELEPHAPTTKGPADRFTGDVWVDAVARPRPQPERRTAGLVHFAPGARTAWHVHALGQTLLITAGTAVVQSRDGTTVLAGPGDTVHTPPGEWHWHGAVEDRFTSHLALSESVPEQDGPPVTWGEHVPDDVYLAAARSGRAG